MANKKKMDKQSMTRIVCLVVAVVMTLTIVVSAIMSQVW